MKADAFPVYKNPKTGYINKKPVYWRALVSRDSDGVPIWSDGGWHSKRAALSVANNWIAQKINNNPQEV